MKTSTMYFFSAPMLVAWFLVLSGCGRSSSNFTNIFYRPAGICKGYESPAGPITAGANKAFAVFKIDSVDNTKYGSSFIFAPERLFVNQSPPVLAAGSGNRRFVYPDPKFARTMGFKSIPQTTIPAGEKLDINSVVIIPLGINNPSGGAEANQFSFELAYDTGSGQRGEQQNVNEDIVFT
ncbi:MAG: hypothetical protein ACREDV_00575, partial [Methylocella sp.]